MATLTEMHGAAVGAADALKVLTAQVATTAVAPASPVVAAAIGTVFGPVKTALASTTATTVGINVSLDAPTSAALLAALPALTAYLATIGVTL
jgi:hypothetical protein